MNKKPFKAYSIGVIENAEHFEQSFEDYENLEYPLAYCIGRDNQSNRDAQVEMLDSPKAKQLWYSGLKGELVKHGPYILALVIYFVIQGIRHGKRDLVIASFGTTVLIAVPLLHYFSDRGIGFWRGALILLGYAIVFSSFFTIMLKYY